MIGAALFADLVAPYRFTAYDLLLVAITMVSANLVVDLLYGMLDPRLRSRVSRA